MTTGLVTEGRAVARKKPSKERQQPDPVAADRGPPFGRIELQAPPDWIAELDAVAEAMGLSRSAFIRLACNKQMAAVRKELGIDKEDG